MRRSRSFTAVFAIVAFLFAQATTAAYACAGRVADPAAMAEMKAAMGNDGGLCEKHCATGTVSFEVAKPAASSIPAVTSLALRVVEMPPVARAIVVRAAPLSAAG